MSLNPALVAAMGGKAANGIFVDMSIDGPEIGTLVVYIDRAKNLPSRRTMGKQDPYCAVRFGKEVRKTDTDRRGGQTPRWEQKFTYTVHDSPDYFKLKMSVFNDDKKTELIGEAWLSLVDVVVPGGGSVDTWQSLECKGKYSGEVRIEARYVDSRKPEPEASPSPLEHPNSAGSRRDYGTVRRRPIAADAFDQPDQVGPARRQYQSYDPSRMSEPAGFNPHGQMDLYDYDDRDGYHHQHAYGRSPGTPAGGYIGHPDAPDESYMDDRYRPGSYNEQPYHDGRNQYQKHPSSAHITPERSPVDEFHPRMPRRADTMPMHLSGGHQVEPGYEQYADFSISPPHHPDGRFADDMAGHSRPPPPPPTHRRTYTGHPTDYRPDSRSPGFDQVADTYADNRGHGRRHTMLDKSRLAGYADSPHSRSGPVGIRDSSLPQLPPSRTQFHRRYDSPSGPSHDMSSPGTVNYKRLPPRKSIISNGVGSSIATPPAAPPTTPFSPESFDAYNPNMRRSDLRTSPGPMHTIREGLDSDPPQIINLHGAVIDPSDHLPVDTWAPEPERKSPPKPVVERERPIGARDPRSRAPAGWSGPSSRTSHSPFGSVGRISGRAAGSTVGLIDRHGSSFNSLGRPASSRGYVSEHGVVAERAYGSMSRVGLRTNQENSGLSSSPHKTHSPHHHHHHHHPQHRSQYPSQGQKQQFRTNHGQVYNPQPNHESRPGGDDLGALSAEMQMIDIGSGTTRRGLRATDSTFY